MTVYVTGANGQSAEGATSKDGRLTLVDLAGNDDSRKGASSQQSRVIDTSSVQHALAALGNAVAALHMNQAVSIHDSKLTQVLHESLVAGSLTTMLTCIAPHPKYYHDTSSSLAFAAQARGQSEALLLKLEQAGALRANRAGAAPAAHHHHAAAASMHAAGGAMAAMRGCGGGGGGSNGRSFASMMAPPPTLTHPPGYPPHMFPPPPTRRECDRSYSGK